MVGKPITVVLWNVQWARPNSPRGRAILRVIEDARPDVVCLTEAYSDFLRGGRTIESAPDYGYPIVEGRRKVLLWSRWPWRSQMQLTGAMPSGRYIAGWLQSPGALIQFVAVCVPWRAAHVSTGRRDRQPWEDHLAYLAALETRASKWDWRTIVLGDFNQAIPPRRQPTNVHAQLAAAVQYFQCLTEGLEHDGRSAIDHAFHSPDIEGNVIGVLPMTLKDLRLSDHFGLVLQFQVN